ncbi:L,D-transpeptidase [Streptomyces zingiberis]|uniref:L,D-transpeptidase n=1 Tax=Streptomyces zingiberis TaxID=2053010 RepID=A0ABX1C009_9ACTN|nr:L,D-transpeptidase [Streptomyces zingiberis]NJQ03257.1 L,D-transpeptidase [Streptomyces zingiberis]
MGPAGRCGRWTAAVAAVLSLAGCVFAVAEHAPPSPTEDNRPRQERTHEPTGPSGTAGPGGTAGPTGPGASPGPGGRPAGERTPAEGRHGPQRSGASTAGAPSGPCTARTGPYQRTVERFLGLTVDGRQSEADCRAIRAWQHREGLDPAIGFAGPAARDHVRRLTARRVLADARRDPNAAGRCPVVRERVACVDLARQLMWVQRGREVLMGPVHIRTGKAGRPTRTGTHRVFWRNRDHFSTLYKTPMPYAQFFDGGQAFHAVRDDIHDPAGGSHGCVNLTRRDARRLWDTLRINDQVYVWGRRPGT